MAGYATITQVDLLLGQALTSSAPHVDGKVDLWHVGHARNRNDIPDDLLNSYIRWASDELDSNLSEMYRTPLIETSQGEAYLAQDIDEYNPTNVITESPMNLIPGDKVIIVSTAYSPQRKEEHIVATVISDDEFTTVDPIMTDFPAGEETRVVRVGFPPAVTFVVSRRACANIYDKFFAAQVSPDASSYGENLRTLALSQMSDILNGTVILHGQYRLGNRFANANLYDRFQLIQRDGNDKKELNKQ